MTARGMQLTEVESQQLSVGQATSMHTQSLRERTGGRKVARMADWKQPFAILPVF